MSITNFLKRLYTQPKTTAQGLAVGALTSGITGMSSIVAAGGPVPDWRIMLASAIVPTVAGAFSKDPAPTTTNTEALASIGSALDTAANAYITQQATKIITNIATDTAQIEKQ